MLITATTPIILPRVGTATEPFHLTNSQFSLNLIELQLDKPVDKTSPLGFRVAFGFGQAINAVNNATIPVALRSAQYLKEGYMSYMAPVGKGLQIDAGKFVTPAGAEVIETNQNWNYSRSLLFYVRDSVLPLWTSRKVHVQRQMVGDRPCGERLEQCRGLPTPRQDRRPQHRMECNKEGHDHRNLSGRPSRSGWLADNRRAVE